jgi:hypothetical protein
LDEFDVISSTAFVGTSEDRTADISAHQMLQHTELIGFLNLQAEVKINHRPRPQPYRKGR